VLHAPAIPSRPRHTRTPSRARSSPTRNENRPDGSGNLAVSRTGKQNKWRVVGTFRDTDSTPKEAFVFHAAGLGGMGDAS